MNGSTKLQSSQANSGCMLSGARRVHPVIVGWSTLCRADWVGNDSVRTTMQVPACYATTTQFLRRAGAARPEPIN
jgi:hypothetical protein